MSGAELITRRRKWSPTQKAALLEEVEDEGGKVAVVARRTAFQRACCTIGARHGRRRHLRRTQRSRWHLCLSVSWAKQARRDGHCWRHRKRTDRRHLRPAQARLEQSRLRSERCPYLCCWGGEREGVVAGSARHAGYVVISLAACTKVFLACRPVGVRNGFDGLAAKAQQVIGADPFSGHLFIFRGKRGQQATFSIQFSYCQNCVSMASSIRADVAGIVPPPWEGSAMYLHGRTARP